MTLKDRVRPTYPLPLTHVGALCGEKTCFNVLKVTLCLILPVCQQVRETDNAAKPPAEKSTGLK